MAASTSSTDALCAGSGLKIVSHERDDETTTGAPADGWREWLAENNRVTPADEAAFRIDFGRWLAGLPERKRQMAELLLQGHRTGAVAETVEHLGRGQAEDEALAGPALDVGVFAPLVPDEDHATQVIDDPPGRRPRNSTGSGLEGPRTAFE